MNAVELRSKSLDDLEQELLNLRREQFNFEHATFDRPAGTAARVRTSKEEHCKSEDRYGRAQSEE